VVSPEFDPKAWREVEREEHEGDDRHAHSYSFVITLQRV